MSVLFDGQAQLCDRMRDLCGSDDNSHDQQPRHRSGAQKQADSGSIFFARRGSAQTGLAECRI